MDWIKFLELSIVEKARVLYEEGTFIMSIRYYGYKINLFLLNETYYEVFYNHKFDRIDKIDPLERNHSRMKFYEDQIKLPGQLSRNQ